MKHQTSKVEPVLGSFRSERRGYWVEGRESGVDVKFLTTEGTDGHGLGGEVFVKKQFHAAAA
jgi:hypothetical protein